MLSLTTAFATPPPFFDGTLLRAMKSIFNTCDILAHPSLQTKVKVSRLKSKTMAAAARKGRRAFLRDTMLVGAFLIAAVFMSSPWPISRVSKIHHSVVQPSIASLFRVRNATRPARNASLPRMSLWRDDDDKGADLDGAAAVLWDAAFEKDESLG
jgi:hypothetical protein